MSTKHNKKVYRIWANSARKYKTQTWKKSIIEKTVNSFQISNVLLPKQQQNHWTSYPKPALGLVSIRNAIRTFLKASSVILHKSTCKVGFNW